ncbi:MAG: hypothetical protein MR727_11820 [Lentisphaeria bacterium]|nr:hypothetical protein [Lentisphaeria bacterium]
MWLQSGSRNSSRFRASGECRAGQRAPAAKLLDKAERIADTMQSRREIAFLKLGLEHARLTLLMGQAHLARVHNNFAEDQRDFQRKYEALMKFRETHESSGISWMSVLNSFEDYNFYCSLNGKK